MFVSIENLESLARALAEILGDDFIRSRLEKYGVEQVPTDEQKRRDLKAHPLARQWRAFKNDIQKSKAEKKLHLSTESIYLLDLLDALLRIQALSGHERILDDIRNVSQFHSAAYEARIVSQYLRAGSTIEIVPEGVSKSCDFRLISRDGSPIGIECKSLQDTAYIESVIWGDVLSKIAKSLMRHSRNWRMRIYSKSSVDESLAAMVCAEAEALARRDALGYHDVADHRAAIECLQIAKSGEEFEGGFQANSDSEIIDMTCKMRFAGGVSRYSEPKIVEIHPYIPDDQSISILNGVKKAADQLAKEQPNVVYVQVPHQKGPRIQAVVDNAFSVVADVLRRNHGRINACVITGQFPHIVLNPNESPLAWTHTVVPNDRASNAMPSDVTLVGTNDLELDLATNEGAIALDFSLESPWAKQRGRSLYYHCSKDGRQQLRVWHSLDGKLRVDVYTPKLGRVVGAGRPIFVDRTVHKLAASWSSSGVSIYVDGSAVV